MKKAKHLSKFLERHIIEIEDKKKKQRSINKS